MVPAPKQPTSLPAFSKANGDPVDLPAEDPDESQGSSKGETIAEQKANEQSSDAEASKAEHNATSVPMPALPENEVAADFEQPPAGPSVSSVANAPTEDDGTQSLALDYSVARENFKCVAAIVFTVLAWSSIFIGLQIGKDNYKPPDCEVLRREKTLRSCEVCGEGTLFLPLFGDYENSWMKGPRVPLYFFGVLCTFMGMGIVCDMFMDAIEEVTSSEKLIWREVHQGGKQKFHVKFWNPTMANLTLMALGSSAPEILLSCTELIGNRYFAGRLGPSTIVGSAAFNLFVISAVCISAIPAPETRTIEGMSVFMVTSFASLFAYIWLLVILLVVTPDKVDIWEGAVTFTFFPILLILAFMADKEIGCFKQSEPEEKALEDIEKQANKRVSAQYGNADLPQDTLKLFLQQPLSNSKQVISRAQLRRLVTGVITGGMRRPKPLVLENTQTKQTQRASKAREKITIGFAESRHQVLECAGSISVKVVASAPAEQLLQVRYFTSEGSAKKELRFSHVEGFLSFAPGITQKCIEIPIIDDDCWEPDEEFYVELADLTVVAQTNLFSSATSSMWKFGGKGDRSNTNVSNVAPDPHKYLTDHVLGQSQTTVTVLNDDIPGTLEFDADEVFTTEGETVAIGVVRLIGNCGAISCRYETIDDSAVGGRDYEAQSGVIKFEDGQTHQKIHINIKVSPDHIFEGNERFKVMLVDPSPGVLFDINTDGGSASAICDVVIGERGSAQPHVRFLRRYFNRDKLRLGMEQWQEQIIDSLYCGGSMDDQANAGVVDWLCHILSLVFKLMFVVVPPSMLGGGWIRFIMSLVMIGLVTAFAGDIASLLGCCLGIPDDITAITLVALGTSLPDTLASKAAALQDDTADDAIGNITGSNSVNVFLGIGISWTIGAIYWERSTPPTKEWREFKFLGEKTLEDLFINPASRIAHHPTGGFFVPCRTLLFSVAAYTTCALVCLSYLNYRRHKYGGELGGPRMSQICGAIFLLSMWAVYVVAVAVYALATE